MYMLRGSLCVVVVLLFTSTVLTPAIIEFDVAEYATLQAFFTRRLREGSRAIASAGLASPCDGRVLHFGALEHDGSLEQIKGSRFTLDAFIGQVPRARASLVSLRCLRC